MIISDKRRSPHRGSIIVLVIFAGIVVLALLPFVTPSMSEEATSQLILCGLGVVITGILLFFGLKQWSSRNKP